MENNTEFNLDDATIQQLGLKQTDTPINAQIPQNARVFKYPQLENVFVMECDLYGNVMPKGSCFLAFQGNHGLLGQHLKIETLKSASIEDIRKIIAANAEG